LLARNTRWQTAVLETGRLPVPVGRFQAVYDERSDTENLLLPGDLNDDGQVNAADLSAMMAALADLTGYESAYGLSDSELLTIADLNGDRRVTNADIQGLINLLATSDFVAAAEPSALLLAAVGVSGLIVAHLRRTFTYFLL